TRASVTWQQFLSPSLCGALLAINALCLFAAILDRPVRFHERASTTDHDRPIVRLSEIDLVRAGIPVTDHLEVNLIWSPVRASVNIAFVLPEGNRPVRQSEDKSVKLQASVVEVRAGSCVNAVLGNPFFQCLCGSFCFLFFSLPPEHLRVFALR